MTEKDGFSQLYLEYAAAERFGKWPHEFYRDVPRDEQIRLLAYETIRREEGGISGDLQ